MRIPIVLLAVIGAISSLYAQPPGRGGFGGARFLGAEPGMPGRVVKNAPYSADLITETAHTLADGNRIRQSSTSRIYRDTEGRTRREQSLRSLNGLAPNSNLPQVVFIDDPVAGVNYAMTPSTRTATKSVRQRFPGGAAPGGRRGPDRGSEDPLGRRGAAENARTESLGRQLIEGVPADGTRTTLTIPVGQIGNDQPIQIVSESWYSPDLQTVVLSKRSDPRSGETIFKLTNISRADPPRTLFDVPVDYKISEGQRLFRRPGQ